MSDIGRKIDAVINERVAPLLKARGFKKKARNFRRRAADALQVINIQASQSNQGTSGRFTVNLGLYFPAAALTIGRYEEIAEPTESDCPLRERIGCLMPTSSDVWWDVEATTDAGALSETVAGCIVQYGLPWLDRMSVLATAARSEHRRASRITHAALLLADGDRDACVGVMTTSIMETDRADGGWIAFATAAGLVPEYQTARAARAKTGS